MASERSLRSPPCSRDVCRQPAWTHCVVVAVRSVRIILKNDSEEVRHMIPREFEYHAPKTIPDALGLLAQFGDEAKLLAGGHSLLPMMKLRFAQPGHLIDLGKIRELKGI